MQLYAQPGRQERERRREKCTAASDRLLPRTSCNRPARRHVAVSNVRKQQQQQSNSGGFAPLLQVLSAFYSRARATPEARPFIPRAPGTRSGISRTQRPSSRRPRETAERGDSESVRHGCSRQKDTCPGVTGAGRQGKCPSAARSNHPPPR